MHKHSIKTESLMDITPRPDIFFKRGKGSWIWDNTGKKYLDFVQGWAVNCLGHCPDEIVTTLQDQGQTLLTPSPAFFNEPAIALADTIVDNSCFDRVFFANSGAEANEGAIKLSRKWGEINADGAYEIITFENSFHGRTLATMSASGKPQFAKLFEPKVSGFPKARLNDIASVTECINSKTVAVMVEPIQGEAGVIVAEDEFLLELRELTQKYNLLLIMDEIQTGVGRTGKLWGHQYSGITPDIMTLGKMLGGGVPLAALVATERVCCFEYGDQGGTYNGNPLMTAVGNTVMNCVLQHNFLQQVEATGQYLRMQLEQLSSSLSLGEVRGRGLLLALDLPEKIGPQIVQLCLQHGLLLNAPRADILRFIPALNVSENEIDQMVTILGETFKGV